MLRKFQVSQHLEFVGFSGVTLGREARVLGKRRTNQ